MFFMLMSLILSSCFLFLNHPMTLGMTLLLQTIIISMITGMLNMNFWFSYILFLIMIGGLLVLFIYMTSIASNEMFNYSNKIMLIILFLVMTCMMIYMCFDNFMINMLYSYKENILLMKNMSLIKFFNYPSMLMVFFMIIYLFITLIAVVKITKIESGPLRQKF
uniref:NADH-ubiquinone oxidoreductase chain 6 n=1 Tax=Oxypoda acuminata TaxID=346815 RepID=A0A0S2M897_9COLE|nr:NADH dehydrogenase subunit 6 [Oxypoda acuminata]ALO70812.1 NADH dehydrogenase subunit 6 [Oxypoda acuminata]